MGDPEVNSAGVRNVRERSAKVNGEMTVAGTLSDTVSDTPRGLGGTRRWPSSSKEVIKEVDRRQTHAPTVCEALMGRGVLSKETHETVVRFASPFVITKAQIHWAVDQVRAVFQSPEVTRAA